MRTFFGIVIAVVVAATIWWTFPIQAKQQYGHDSIDPLAMTGTVRNFSLRCTTTTASFFRNSNDRSSAYRF